MNSREGEGGTLMSEYMIMTDSTVFISGSHFARQDAFIARLPRIR